MPQRCNSGVAPSVSRGLPQRPRRPRPTRFAMAPARRIGIAAAKAHSFLQSPGAVLTVRMDRVQGKHDKGTIAEAKLDPDLLRYLQTCPSWNSFAQQFLESAGQAFSKCVRQDEAEKGFKSEFAYFVDEERPPKGRSLNGVEKLFLIPSRRFAAFVRALKIAWRPW